VRLPREVPCTCSPAHTHINSPTKEAFVLGADMIVRTLYLLADTTINLMAAKAVAGRLSKQATVEDLWILLEYGWIVDETLPDTYGDGEVAARAGQLRQLAERRLCQLLDQFARSLDTRDVDCGRYDGGDSPGIDEYSTGGLSHGDAPTEAFDDWDIVMAADRFPDGWAGQIGAAAGLLHPRADGPAVATVTFRAWG